MTAVSWDPPPLGRRLYQTMTRMPGRRSCAGFLTRSAELQHVKLSIDAVWCVSECVLVSSTAVHVLQLVSSQEFQGCWSMVQCLDAGQQQLQCLVPGHNVELSWVFLSAGCTARACFEWLHWRAYCKREAQRKVQLGGWHWTQK